VLGQHGCTNSNKRFPMSSSNYTNRIHRMMRLYQPQAKVPQSRQALDPQLAHVKTVDRAAHASATPAAGAAGGHLARVWAYPTWAAALLVCSLAASLFANMA
jgi:hypothetical protein